MLFCRPCKAWFRAYLYSIRPLCSYSEMFLRPTLVLFTITQAALTGAAVRGTGVLTAPPAFQPTDAPSPALSYTLSCPGCQTIPIITTSNILTTTIWCGLPCSTVYFTGTGTATGPLEPIQTEYGQCGGTGWEGPTVCKSPSICQAVVSPYYYQVSEFFPLDSERYSSALVLT
ncbi:hypothetical protein B0H16DRAFT_279597 [Mycena metata]|uniref:CBM1 domain-containing protein n=1 Tax=Mycena metata TaxID=1033252 RepID=A0AAD7HQ73_9AGAR|nr:hypothetical protein B0H16DRAFT_279597 [Mycena metata]